MPTPMRTSHGKDTRQLWPRHMRKNCFCGCPRQTWQRSGRQAKWPASQVALSLVPDRSPLTDALLEPPKQISCIPHMENRQFVGRYTELETLKRFVNTALESRWGDASRDLAVFGPVGIGKTQLVLILAHWVANQHADTSVFWLPATSVEAFASAADMITHQLGIRTPANAGEDVKELLKRHLSLNVGKWLLIIDNADGAETLEPYASSDGLLRYLPQTMFGVTILTTRSASLAQRFAGSELLRLKKLPENEAVELLTKYIIRADVLADPIAATAFLAELGHEPLAIIRAAAYINDNEISLSEYSRLFPSTGSATSSALDSALQ